MKVDPPPCCYWEITFPTVFHRLVQSDLRLFDVKNSPLDEVEVG